MFVFSVSMKNVSFKANLIVNQNLYNSLPKQTEENYVENLITDYKKFLDNKFIKEATKNDTIEISRIKYQGGFAIGLKYTSDTLSEPIESGIYTNSKIPSVTPGSLSFQTQQFIIKKSGIKLYFLENHKDRFMRAIKEILKTDKK